MLRVFIALLGLVCLPVKVSATTQEALIQNLSSRMHKLPHAKGSLIKSFTTHSQSYIYDQALAIIAFTKANKKNKASELLLGLKSLQMKDGSLYFSYYLNGESPYPIEGDKRFAGAIAWVALAATHYQHHFKSKEFYSFNKKVLAYLQTQIAPIALKRTKTKALKFSPTDIKSTPWKENETAALEHNLDAYAAFFHFDRINDSRLWNQEVAHLKIFIMNMWDSSRSHFWSGANIKTGTINQSELYLDNQSWSLLALDNKTLREIDPKLALELNCDAFFVEHEGVVGFMDSKPTRRPASSKFVWSEGTLGQVLAMKKIDQTSSCKNQSPDQILVSISKMKQSDGGISYATKTPNPDFTTASSVAGTAWLYFAVQNINPFEV